MTFKATLLGAAIAVLPTLASAHMVIEDAFARVTHAGAQSAAVYISLRNHSDDEDRFFRVDGDVAERVEIHTHTQDDAGVMRMVELEEGIAIPSGDTHLLRPGGDHIMLLGLTEPLEQGDTFELVLYFDVWLPETITVTVDNEAVDALVGDGGHGDHGGHTGDEGDHSGHGDDHSGHGDG